MRIAVFYNLAFGGAKRVVYEQVKGLSKTHLVDLYTLSGSIDSFDPIKFAQNRYEYDFVSQSAVLPFFRKLQSDIRVFLFLDTLHKKIAHDIDLRKYDIVLVHPDRFTQAPFILKHLQTMSVYYCQEPLRIVYEYSLRFKKNVSIVKKMYEELTRYIRKRIDRDNVRAATFCLASCLHIRERMIEVYDVYPKISYPGIDPTIFKPIVKKRRKTVIFIGNKDVVTDGYDLAVDALNKIPKSIRPNLLVISWRKNNKKRLTDKQMARIYSGAVAVLCLSKLETFGLVPLESMACGTPVIATNISGHRETVMQEKTGFLVDFDSVEIAKKITYLIHNPSKIEEIGNSGRNHILASWAWSKRNAELEEHISDYITTKQ